MTRIEINQEVKKLQLEWSGSSDLDFDEWTAKKIVDLREELVAMTLERDEFDEENKKQAGHIRLLKEIIESMKAERKQIIEQNASQALRLTLEEHSLGKSNTTIINLEQEISQLNKQVHSQQELIESQETKIASLKHHYDYFLGRVNGLEEWLSELRDQLKKTSEMRDFNRNTLIGDINEILNEND